MIETSGPSIVDPHVFAGGMQDAVEHITPSTAYEAFDAPYSPRRGSAAHDTLAMRTSGSTKTGALVAH